MKVFFCIDITNQAGIKADEEFTIEHRTVSSEFDFHRLNIQLKCYKLGNRFKELLGVGADTSF